MLAQRVVSLHYNSDWCPTIIAIQSCRLQLLVNLLLTHKPTKFLTLNMFNVIPQSQLACDGFASRLQRFLRHFRMGPTGLLETAESFL